MSRLIPHTVSFREVTGYTVTVDAVDTDDAIEQAAGKTTTLSPAERARTFTVGTTGYEDFKAEANTKSFRVVVETKAIYEIEVDAIDRDDAEEIADDKWNAHGPDDFEFQDFDDVHFDAEEVEP
jgi:hypothetical protein